MAQFGNHLGHISGCAIEGNNHIQFIHSRQRNQRVGIRNTLALQKILFPDIAVNDIRLRQLF